MYIFNVTGGGHNSYSGGHSGSGDSKREQAILIVVVCSLSHQIITKTTTAVKKNKIQCQDSWHLLI